MQEEEKASRMDDEIVKRAAAGIRRLFIERDTDQPMPSFEDIARAALETGLQPRPYRG